MKRLIFFLLCILCVSVVQAADTPKSLVVMLDGVRSDAQRMAETPNIDALMDGSWAPGYKGAWTFTASTIRDAPPNSAPNHAAIATGTSAAQSRVKDNNYYVDYNKKEADAVYKNYLSRIKNDFSRKNVAFLYSWGPDEILTQENNPCDLSLKGSDEENAKRVPLILSGKFSHENWLLETDVDALLFYIDLPDGAGHAGGFSPPGGKHDGYLRSIEICDRWIGEALQAIRERPTFEKENWQIIICSDHGGWVSSHGIAREDNYTVPLVVSSKDVQNGKMPGLPCTTDVAVTVLDHFGLDVDDLKRRSLLDGSVRGKSKPVSASRSTPETDLLLALSFNGKLENEAKGKIPETIKPRNVGASIKTSGGKKGGYLEIRAGEKKPFLSLDKPMAMDWGTDGDFSVAFWLRMPEKSDSDPVLIGNKDWEDGKNPGVCLYVTGESNGGGNNLSLNLADAWKRRIDVKQLNMTPGQWWFCAATVDRKENATIYVGSPEGKLFFGSMSLVGEALGVQEKMPMSLNSSLPWNIGQDGTGNYKAKLNADFDEFRVWGRALSMEEIDAIYRQDNK